jgi:cell division protein FtsL
MKIKVSFFFMMFLISVTLIFNLILNNLINVEYENIAKLNTDIIELQKKSSQAELNYLNLYSVQSISQIALNHGFEKLPVKKFKNTDIKPYKYEFEEQKIKTLGFNW